MAAVKPHKPRPRKGSSIPPRSASRLETLRLEGADALRPSPRSVGAFLAGGVMLLGVSAAGAAWIGGSLLDAQDNVGRYGDQLATQAGFGLSQVEIRGVDGPRAAEVRAAAGLQPSHSLFLAQPQAVRDRLRRLDWVQSVRVTRLWPATLRIVVTRREAAALWQQGGQVRVVDGAGRVLAGAGAADAAEPLLAALEDAPGVRTRLSALVRVGDRRWDLRLRSGATVLLPETGGVAAVKRLEGLQTRYALLDRPVQSIDMRAPQRLVVRPAAKSTIAPNPGA
jgi:cell division protein FtsQ